MFKKYLLSLFLLGSSLAAQDECFSSCECCDGPCSGSFNVRHRDPGGIGFSRGYTSADLFYSHDFFSNCYGYIDGRGHIFNNGKGAANLGIGARARSECLDSVFGANLYWDWRQTNHTDFHQIGAGLEFLCPCFDLRINGYAPINRHRKSFQVAFDKFKGNRAFFFKEYELAMWGVDVNAGYWLYRCDWLRLHAGLGGYYFQGDFSEKAGGGLFRAKMHICDWIRLEGQVSYDNQFKWQGNGQLGLHFSFGKTVQRYHRQTNCCPDIIALEERLVEQPERFEIIVSTNHKTKGRARNPTTGDLLTFYFVDNTSNSNGTFESPFPTLQQALDISKKGDAIYIFPGDGSATGMNNLIAQLKDFQLFGGSGAPFEVLTRFGRLEIPAQTSNLPLAKINLRVASHNFISGMNMSLPGSNVLTGLNFNSVSVKNNVIFSEASLSVIMDFFSGNCIFENNVITGDGTALAFENFNGTLKILNNLITSGTSHGVSMESFTSGIIQIENNVIHALEVGAKGITIDGLIGEFQSKNNQIFVAPGEFQIGVLSPP